MSERSAFFQKMQNDLWGLLVAACLEEGILLPGERLVVSIIITPQQENQDVPEEFLVMKTRDFFTRKHFEEAGVSLTGRLPRVAYLWRYEEYLMTHGGRHPSWNNNDVPTIREVLVLGQEGLRKHGIHRDGIQAMVDVLAHFGITLR